MRLLQLLSATVSATTVVAELVTLNDQTEYEKFVAQSPSLVLFTASSCNEKRCSTANALWHGADLKILEQSLVKFDCQKHIEEAKKTVPAEGSVAEMCTHLKFPVIQLVYGDKEHKTVRVYGGQLEKDNLIQFAARGFARNLPSTMDPEKFRYFFNKLATNKDYLNTLLKDPEGSILLDNFVTHVDITSRRIEYTAHKESMEASAVRRGTTFDAPPSEGGESGGASAKEFKGSKKAVDLPYIDPTSNIPTVVKFYAPWCGHCKALAPVWDQLAKYAGKEVKNVMIAKIDCTKYNDVCSEHQVSGYPTIKAYLGKVVIPYQGKRDLESLKAWVKQAGNKGNWGHKNPEKDGPIDVDVDDDL